MPRALCALLLSLSVLPVAARELVVSREGTQLRAACGAAGPPLASLPQGQEVTLRFSFAGADERCYSVRAQIDGRSVNGYVERDALEGIEAVEQRRREVSFAQLATTAVESIRVESPIAAPASGAPLVAPTAMQDKLQAAAEAFQAGRAHEVAPLLEGVPRDNLVAAVLRGSAFLRLTRPGEAQAALDPALHTHPNDPDLLGLAGVAAFQQDRTADAAKLLAQSVKLRPNQALSNLLARIQTEQSADQSDDKTYGSRFILRYDGQALPDDDARALARELDGELPAVSSRLGCQIQDRLTVVVQTMDDYRSGAGAPGWSGGHYDGRIHLALGADHQIDARVRETMSHELVHACLARRGEWPAWFQEGVAQFVSGRRLAPEDRVALAELSRAGKLPTMQALSGSWARLGPHTAQIAYTAALAAAQVMFQDMQDYGVRNLLSKPSALPTIAAKLDQRLKETLR